MIHHRKLEMPCPACGRSGAFGVLFVTQNQLVRGCSSCQHTENIPLPSLRKTILYLDQCFLSSAFRANDPRFVAAAKRIHDLAARQLLVCPWSSLHEAETHQWPDVKQQDLWVFIKKTANGHKFAHSASIRSTQIAASFNAFLLDDPSRAALDLTDAFHSNIHEWEGFVWVDVRMRLDDSAGVRQGKALAAKQMVAAFDGWRAHSQSFAEDLRSEWTGYAQAIVEEYVHRFLNPNLADPLAFLDSGNAQIFNMLMIEQHSNEPFDIRFDRAKRFLNSESFAFVPHIDASCRLMAVLRRALRRGELASQKKAERAMYGFGQDMEMVSVFAPYVDAVFMDRTMHRWITERECDLPARFGFRAFSAGNWKEFDKFLDEIERGQPADHGVWLKTVYGQLA